VQLAPASNGQPTGRAGECGPNWAIVPSPNSGDMGSDLWDVVALGPTEATAVGSSFTDFGEGIVSQTLIEHWDGAAWAIVPSPNGLDSDSLLGVSATSADDVWAVGSQVDNSPEGNTSYALAEHWDGTSWTIDPTPQVGTSGDNLLDVVALSPTDVWAVGVASDNGRGRTLTLHWDGSTWLDVPSPSGGTLRAVTALSETEAWAVGSYIAGGDRTLIERWDGSRWKMVSSPSPGTYDDLLGVDGRFAPGGHAALAVGSFTTDRQRPLVEQWSGREWRVVPSPDIGAVSASLSAVSVISPVRAWAVGDYYTGLNIKLLTERWDGTRWTAVRPPEPTGGTLPNLLGADTDPTGQTWAVGGFARGLKEQTLIECITVDLMP
jgi:hypothetical protein